MFIQHTHNNQAVSETSPVKNLFGTDGIRARAGSFPLTPQHLPILGKAIGKWLYEQYHRHIKLIIGQDTRISCSTIQASLKLGLLQFPITIYNAHIVPTPVLSAILLHHQKEFDLALMISASHNPYFDNGIKIIDQHGRKITQENEVIISRYFYDLLANNTITSEQDDIVIGTTVDLPCISKQYLDIIAHYFDQQFLSTITIIIDCAHGAFFQLAPALFKFFGATVIAINNNPDGTNINAQCGSLFPKQLSQAMQNYHADIGFATDGDGDRLIAVNKQGQIIDGDGIIAILQQHQCYQHESTLAGTIMSNEGLVTYLKTKKIEFIRTSVGDIHVLQALKDNNLLLGGEPSGHIIMRDYLDSSDAIFTALRLLEVVIKTKNWNLDTFQPYPQIVTNIPITIKPDLSREPYTTMIGTFISKLTNGRLVVRCSGTTDIIRIMVEASNASHVKKISKELTKALEQQLKQG